MQVNIEGKTRQDILQAAFKAGKAGAHVAPSLSLVEISLAVLDVYDRAKDVVVLSKGHGALGYYAAMHQKGFISDAQFSSFEENGGEFPGQPSRTKTNCIDYSGGTLGVGLSYATGCVIAGKRAFVILGDGEMNEGSNWEAADLAAKMNLNRLFAIVDNNGLQSDGECDNICAQNLAKIWSAHGWDVISCDGHSTNCIKEAIIKHNGDKPLAIIAKTTKGKGVSFMENNNEWHHHELTEEKLKESLLEVEQKYGLS